MSYFGAYGGKEFFEREFPKREFLVDKIMRESDSVLLIGTEKSGKSIVIKQLICSLTTGTYPFLDEYEVKKPCKVTYIQLEGEIGDTQDRFKRMIKHLDFNPDNFQIIFSQPLQLQQDGAHLPIIDAIEAFHAPQVIVIDPLYFALSGSLSDDEAMRAFLGNIRRIKDHFQCSFVIVHHTHRIKLNQDGEVIDEGDNALFGSSALKWWPDHLILFNYNKKTGLRHFSCNTQRSGDIENNIALELIQPDPLYFRKVGETYHDKSVQIYDELAKHISGLNATEVCEALKISRATFFRDVKKLLLNNKVMKFPNKRPIIYLAKPKIAKND